MTGTTISKLNPSALEAIRGSLSTRNKLQYELNKSAYTLTRWINKNNPKLAEPRSLKIISEETGIPEEKLIQVA